LKSAKVPLLAGQRGILPRCQKVFERVDHQIETLLLRLDFAMSMITAATWVPRGHAAQFPTKYVFDGDEYERIAKLAKLQLDDALEDLGEARAKEKSEKEPEEGSSSHDNGVAQVQSTE
jgi:hypothetical protein